MTEMEIPGLAAYIVQQTDKVYKLVGKGDMAEIILAMLENAYLSGVTAEQDKILDDLGKLIK